MESGGDNGRAGGATGTCTQGGFHLHTEQDGCCSGFPTQCFIISVDMVVEKCQPTLFAPLQVGSARSALLGHPLADLSPCLLPPQPPLAAPPAPKCTSAWLHRMLPLLSQHMRPCQYGLSEDTVLQRVDSTYWK